MEFDVAKEMIKSGIETLNLDVNSENIDEEMLDGLINSKESNRIIH
jgi:hypothetical protein